MRYQTAPRSDEGRILQQNICADQRIRATHRNFFCNPVQKCGRIQLTVKYYGRMSSNRPVDRFQFGTRSLAQTLFLLLVVSALAACVTTSAPIYTDIRSGDQLQLNKAIASIPNGTRLQFQLGERIQPGNLDRWQTYCLIYVYDPTRGAEHRIDLFPDRFKIDQVRAGYRSSDYPFSSHQRYFGSLSWGVRDAPSYYLYRVNMRLQSADQPEVTSMGCYQKWSTPRAQKYPTRAEIREALGDWFELSPSQ